ncbi:MAG: hypothetical protein ACFB6R_01170 [Alphaproteobacteria bacterium]
MTSQQFIRFLVGHALLGFAIAVVFIGMLLISDAANLRTLTFKSDIGLLALGILTLLMGQTFASVQMGVALWLAAREDKVDGPGGGTRLPAGLDHWLMEPARASVRSRR